MEYAALVLLGLAVGVIGTLIGAGGGFLLAPALLLLYPNESPATIASISLAVVFCNALSGSIAYLRQRNVDVRSGVRFSLAAIPGAVLGAVVVSYLPRSAFEFTLGAALMIIGVFLFFTNRKPPPHEHHPADNPLGPRVPHHPGTGMALSLAVGFISSLLGIGGGIIHVPAMVHVLGFPVHVATATSHFVLATTAGTGTITHILTGGFRVGWRRAIALGIGAVIGAQLGARFARKAPPALILKSLALALLLVGGRILLHAVVAAS